MKMFMLSALFAIGVGLTGVGSAAASPAGVGLKGLSTGSVLLEEVQYHPRPRYRGRPICRTSRVCTRGPYGRVRCTTRRICRR